MKARKFNANSKDNVLILNALLENSRMSYRQLAKKLNMSTTTVINKVKQLEKEGIIEKYSAILNYNKLGFEVQVIILAKISQGRMLEIDKKIAKYNNVQAIYDVTGDYDALIIAKFKRREELDSFVKAIQKYEPVERTHTIMIFNTIKEEAIRV